MDFGIMGKAYQEMKHAILPLCFRKLARLFLFLSLFLTAGWLSAQDDACGAAAPNRVPLDAIPEHLLKGLKSPNRAVLIARVLHAQERKDGRVHSLSIDRVLKAAERPAYAFVPMEVTQQLARKDRLKIGTRYLIFCDTASILQVRLDWAIPLSRDQEKTPAFNRLTDRITSSPQSRESSLTDIMRRFSDRARGVCIRKDSGKIDLSYHGISKGFDRPAVMAASRAGHRICVIRLAGSLGRVHEFPGERADGCVVEVDLLKKGYRGQKVETRIKKVRYALSDQRLYLAILSPEPPDTMDGVPVLRIRKWVPVMGLNDETVRRVKSWIARTR